MEFDQRPNTKRELTFRDVPVELWRGSRQWTAISRDRPGLITQAETPQEALDELVELSAMLPP